MGTLTFFDAQRHVEGLFQTQLERAVDEQPLPNQPIEGDAAARHAFLLLLSDSQQRSLYLQIGSKSANWPRMRSLFGSPPYHFLKSTDASALRAGGFARGRSNMAYDERNRIANVAQFGGGQLVDDFEREYRVADEYVDASSDPLPGDEFFARKPIVVLQVKLRKRSRAKKVELLKSTEKKKALFFPQVNEEITLRETKGLLKFKRQETPSSIRLVVRALYQREAGGFTAAVRVSKHE